MKLSWLLKISLIFPSLSMTYVCRPEQTTERAMFKSKLLDGLRGIQERYNLLLHRATDIKTAGGRKGKPSCDGRQKSPKPGSWEKERKREHPLNRVLRNKHFRKQTSTESFHLCSLQLCNCLGVMPRASSVANVKSSVPGYMRKLYKCRPSSTHIGWDITSNRAKGRTASNQ